MTKDDAAQPPARAGETVLGTSERTEVRERLLSITCEWCGTPVRYKGTGRPPRFCSDAHRTRWWEVDSAEKRKKKDAAEGKLRTEPVREVVERTETVVRNVRIRPRTEYVSLPSTAPAPAPAPMQVPQNVAGWVKMLAALEQQIATNPGMQEQNFSWLLADSAERIALMLRPTPLPGRSAATPPAPGSAAGGGLNRAERRRQAKGKR